MKKSGNTKGHVTRKFFLQLATQRRFKLLFTREIASSNTSSLQNNPTAGHTTTCICLQFYRSLKYLFHPNLHSKLQEDIASCDNALSELKHFGPLYRKENWIGILKELALRVFWPWTWLIVSKTFYQKFTTLKATLWNWYSAPFGRV